MEANDNIAEGPIIPSGGEWASTEALRSKDGWVEISKTCMTGDGLDKSTSSENYSPVFSVVLPTKHPGSPATIAPPETFSIPPLTSALPPLFLAPPFTPSHPVFHMFSKHATKASDDLRHKIDLELQALVAQKIQELATKEKELKKDVDQLWKKWRDAWKAVGAVVEAPVHRRRESGQHVPVIKEFNPAPPSANDSSRPIPRISRNAPANALSPSLLSASLATSSMHQLVGTSRSTLENDVDEDLVPSPPSGSPTLASISSAQVGSVSIGPYRRRMDDSVAIAASYQITMEQESDLQAMIASARAHALEKREKELEAMRGAQEAEGSLPPRGRTLPNGKHVQFAEDEREKSPAVDSEEVAIDDEAEVFDFDPPARSTATSDVPETSVTPLSSPRRAALRIAEAVATPSTPPEQTNVTSPSPAAVNRTPADQQLRDIIAADVPSHRAAWKDSGHTWDVFAENSKNSSDRSGSSVEDDQESVISDGSDKIDKPQDHDIARSLPVAIGRLSTRGFVLPKPDSRIPKSSLADKPGILVPPFRQPKNGSSSHGRISSSVATRERAYAARDLSRSVDPGHSLHMGTTVVEEDEEEEEASEESGLAGEMGAPRTNDERSRQRALQILQKSRSNAEDDAL